MKENTKEVYKKMKYLTRHSLRKIIIKEFRNISHHRLQVLNEGCGCGCPKCQQKRMIGHEPKDDLYDKDLSVDSIELELEEPLDIDLAMIDRLLERAKKKKSKAKKRKSKKPSEKNKGKRRQYGFERVIKSPYSAWTHGGNWYGLGRDYEEDESDYELDNSYIGMDIGGGFE